LPEELQRLVRYQLLPPNNKGDFMKEEYDGLIGGGSSGITDEGAGI
jgi:hypothetical protein